MRYSAGMLRVLILFIIVAFVALVYGQNEIKVECPNTPYDDACTAIIEVPNDLCQRWIYHSELTAYLQHVILPSLQVRLVYTDRGHYRREKTYAKIEVTNQKQLARVRHIVLKWGDEKILEQEVAQNSDKKANQKTRIRIGKIQKGATQ